MCGLFSFRQISLFLHLRQESFFKVIRLWQFKFLSFVRPRNRRRTRRKLDLFDLFTHKLLVTRLSQKARSSVIKLSFVSYFTLLAFSKEKSWKNSHQFTPLKKGYEQNQVIKISKLIRIICDKLVFCEKNVQWKVDEFVSGRMLTLTKNMIHARPLRLCRRRPTW